MKGFTLIELIVVMGIMAMLLGLVTINIIRPLRSKSTDSAVNLLLSDIKQQQSAAMGGLGGSQAASPSGIYFSTGSYTLFTGSNYDGANLSNLTIRLQDNLQFSNVLFPSSTLLFASGSGEVIGFSDGANRVRIGSIDGSDTKNLTVNKFGVITSVN